MSFQTDALFLSDQPSGQYFQETKLAETVSLAERNSNRCCDENASNNLVFVLFALSITFFLVTLFIIVFCCNNECTCKKLVKEFKDNLTNAGFGTMTEEQKREYIYEKNRKQLIENRIQPLLENQKSLNNNSSFATIMVQLWPFGKSYNSSQSSPLYSDGEIFPNGLKDDESD